MATKSKKNQEMAKPLKPWLDFSRVEYRQAIGSLVHQSFKTVNTNAAAGGVRIPRESGLKLPYVSARALIGAGVDIHMDRYETAGSAIIYGQIDEVDGGRTKGVPAHDRILIRNELNKVRFVGLVAKGEHVSPRLRQILLPKNGGYVAITPMSCAGVSREIRAALSAHIDAFMEEGKDPSRKSERTLRYIQTARFPIGGGNPRNAGGLAYVMQAPLLADAPRPYGGLREAFSLHFNGFLQVPLSVALMIQYIEWRASVKQRTETNLEVRNQHRAFMCRFARAALQAGSSAQNTLHGHVDKLPVSESLTGSLVSVDASAWSRGLIDPTCRGKGWADEMASILAHAISAWKSPEGEALTLGQQDLNNLATYIKEALL
ncbi:hypothetical protein [Pseudomonas frederiksbergensis]|uniref:hypothetical protein n=1 Tax=Pseudomonas frederiksbergensis TaxID=104087 RepID=UPI003D1A3EAF